MNINLKSVSSRLRYGGTIRPVRDWLVLLVIFFIALVLSVVWNIVQFSRVTHGEPIGTGANVQPAAINIQSIQDLFAAREAERLNYVTKYRFVDPSL